MGGGMGFVSSRTVSSRGARTPLKTRGNNNDGMLCTTTPRGGKGMPRARAAMRRGRRRTHHRRMPSTIAISRCSPLVSSETPRPRVNPVGVTSGSLTRMKGINAAPTKESTR